MSLSRVCSGTAWIASFFALAVSSTPWTSEAVEPSVLRQDAAQAPKRTIWDGVYSGAQAERGEKAYAQHCSGCHGPGLTGGEDGAPALRGAYFRARWTDHTLFEVFQTISTTMPKNGASLTSSEYLDVLSYILYANDTPVGSTELTSSRSALEQIVVTKKTA